MFAVEGYDKNFNVYKDRARIPMFIITRPEFQWLEGWSQNSNVHKNRARILICIKIEFQCLQG